MSPELETLDQLLGGDLPLTVIRKLFPDAERFVRTRRLLEDPGTKPVAGPRAELILSATLAILVTAFTVVIALGR